MPNITIFCDQDHNLAKMDKATSEDAVRMQANRLMLIWQIAGVGTGLLTRPCGPELPGRGDAYPVTATASVEVK